MAYVYKHLRKDTGEIFYIGIGSKQSRMNSKKSRNKYWHNIVNKHGLITEIIEEGLTWNQACDKEKYCIDYYGRENLCNMTDGYKSVLNYFNIITGSNKKDAMFLIKKIKENQIEELKFISSIKINSSK